MDLFLNHMRMQAQAVTQNLAQTRLATISAYDPNNYAVKVLYQPDQSESGWLPILSPWVGNGWGMFSPPTIGQMAKVSFQEGSFEAGMVSLLGFNDVDRPLPAPPGEFWLVHSTGSVIKMNNDGTITIQASTLNLTGNLVMTGDLTVTGSVMVTENITDNTGSNANGMSQMRAIYNAHTHPTPDGTSSAPNQPM
jgi:phage baseplate assembly protein gpV